MRSAPPLELRVRHFGIWHAGVLALAAAACAAMAAWWLAQPAPPPVWVNALAWAGLAAALGATLGPARQRPLTLRWDGQHWHLQPDGGAGASGAVAVAIDLGAWLLLRFVADGPQPARTWRRRVVWIALQRGGLEAQWHALRCTVYAAHPDASPGRIEQRSA